MVNLEKSRAFAMSVVTELRKHGFTALWAGGCVRDQLLGKTPKDFDVATDATPDQIRKVFGQRKTISVGAAFGVITVLGPREAGQIEVATFRRDEGYSDGRRPDRVAFTSAEEDAKRRDFTINGLFFDPIENRVIDYVGGQTDLAAKIVKCIGEPSDRFAEDKLRMLRAIRFAATLDFALDSRTLSAVQKHSQDIHLVSQERIANEMRRMLADPNRAVALQLLKTSQLREHVLPEFQDEDSTAQANLEAYWDRGVNTCRAVKPCSFEVALAALLWPLVEATQINRAEQLARRWKLSNNERELIIALLENVDTIREARQRPWPNVQRILIQTFASQAIDFVEAILAVENEFESNDEIWKRRYASLEFCREKLELPIEQLNPPRLIGGDELVKAGIKPGPKFRALLDSVRDAQLLGEIQTAAEAIEAARELVKIL